MLKPKLSIKIAFFLFVTFFILSVVKDMPESNAFLKDTDSKQLLTSIGDLQVSLVDETVIGQISVSDKHSRDVFVKNKGESAVFVRVLVHPTLENDSGSILIINRDEVFQELTSDWINGKDGYYYYQNKLSAKTQTKDPIFKKIVVGNNLQSRLNLTIYLKVEAITTKGMTYRDSWWEGQKPSLTNKPELFELDLSLQKMVD